MPKHYDNWEKLVAAVLKREQLRKLALSHSRSCSSNTSSYLSSQFDHQLFDDGRKQTETVCLTIDDASIWERFLLPQEYHPQSASRLMNGKVVFIPVEAREFVIRTQDPSERPLISSEDLQVPNAGNLDVVKINSSLLINIGGKISTQLLTSNTIYGVYLVFQLHFSSMWLETANAMNRFLDDVAVKREDGLMEVEIGSFYVDGGDDGEVEARVVETSRHRKGGIIIRGIEFRPLVRVKQL